MTSTVAQSALSTSISSVTTPSPSLGASPPQNDNENPNEYHTVLLVIYSVVLLTGTISLSLMMHIMRSSSTSITSIAVRNLIFAHFLFLVTVPFRIYYYATDRWSLAHGLCKVVSSMIHIHMYMSFIFYVIILVTRLMTRGKDKEEASFNRTHAFVVSAVVWIVVLVMGPLIIHFSYGEIAEKDNTNATQCFKFGRHIESAAKVSNYIISAAIIVVAIVLTALQANVMRVLYRKHRKGSCTAQQDFRAQGKSLCFALIMVVCFIPYHTFRLYYLEHISMQNINEVFLGVTTFNCLDMLTFLGRKTCYTCIPGTAM